MTTDPKDRSDAYKKCFKKFYITRSSSLAISNKSRKYISVTGYGRKDLIKRVIQMMKDQGLRKVLLYFPDPRGAYVDARVWTDDGINYNSTSFALDYDTNETYRWIDVDQPDITPTEYSTVPYIYRCPVCYRYGKRKDCELCKGSHRISDEEFENWFKDAWDSCSNYNSFLHDWEIYR